jgi:hypothetical protein
LYPERVTGSASSIDAGASLPFCDRTDCTRGPKIARAKRMSGIRRSDPAGTTSLFAAVVDPLQRFFKLEAASGILLFVSATVALVWANSPWSESYRAFFASEFVVGAFGRTAIF